MTDEPTRARYADALRKLSEFFPDKCDERQKRLYFERLLGSSHRPEAVEEAVERLIDTHKTRAFPPWSAIADRLRDIAARTRAEEGQRLREGEEPWVPMTPEQIEAEIAENRAFRLKVMPEREPDIRTDRAARRKKFGIQPLTQSEIDMLNRKRRERERARREEVPF